MDKPIRFFPGSFCEQLDLPTPEQIRRRAQAIRDRWTPEEYRERGSACAPTPFQLPAVHVDPNRIDAEPIGP